MNKWYLKEKILFKPNDNFISHIQIPTFKDNKLFFSSRNKNNTSFILNDNYEIIVSPSEKFDINGCSISCFCEDNLFYSGWVKEDYKYHQNICVIKQNKKYLILKKEETNSITINSPFVIKEKIYKMWYVAGSKWIDNTPLYNINYAESKDMLSWKILYTNCIPKKPLESISRPFVLKNKNNYEMYFSSMDLSINKNYKLNKAFSYDGINWYRDYIFLDKRENMECYPFLNNNKLYLNGDNYGKESILVFENTNSLT